MKMITKEALQAVIDDEHMEAFGMTLEECRIKKELDQGAVEIDWESYDAPPNLRGRPRRNREYLIYRREL